MDHELDVALDAGDLVCWNLFKGSSYFIVGGCDYVHYKLVHYLLRTFENCVSLNLLYYVSKALHMWRHLFFFELRLSLIKDFLLLSTNSFLLSDFLIDYFLLATTDLFVTTFSAPPSSSTIHVNFEIHLLVYNKGSSPLVVVAAPHNNFEMRCRLVSRLYYLEVTLKLDALSLDSSVNFDTVVANSEFFVQVPKLSMAARTFNLLLLLSTTDVNLRWNLYFNWYRCTDWSFRVIIRALPIGTVARLVAYSSYKDRGLVGILVGSLESENDIVYQVISNHILAMRVTLCMLMLFRRFRIPLLVFFCLHFCSSGDFPTTNNSWLSGNDGLGVSLYLYKCWDEYVSLLEGSNARHGESSVGLSLDHFAEIWLERKFGSRFGFY